MAQILFLETVREIAEKSLGDPKVQIICITIAVLAYIGLILDEIL